MKPCSPNQTELLHYRAWFRFWNLEVIDPLIANFGGQTQIKSQVYISRGVRASLVSHEREYCTLIHDQMTKVKRVLIDIL